MTRTPDPRITNAIESTRYNTRQPTTTTKLMAYDNRHVVSCCGLSSSVASECAKFALFLQLRLYQNFSCRQGSKCLLRSVSLCITSRTVFGQMEPSINYPLWHFTLSLQLPLTPQLHFSDPTASGDRARASVVHQCLIGDRQFH